MAKPLKYAKAILQFLNDYAHVIPYGFKNVRNQVVADRKNRHYQLVRFGWQDNKHIHYTVFHFNIIDGKVWIQQNRTDLPIDEELEYMGIPKKDVVFAYFSRPPAELKLAAAAA